MTAINVQFSDSTETAVGSVFSCPQDSTAYPNQGTVQDTDPRYLAFLNPPASIAQQATAAMNAGLAITSTATPALNGTYACDTRTQQQIMAESIAIVMNDAFADGTTTLEWPDVTGTLHAFSVAQFKTLATAIAAYVSALSKVMSADAGTLPAATATIA